jgi:acyl-CoA reductase-like NAD-dependent aldehyde dehydrogenase
MNAESMKLSLVTQTCRAQQRFWESQPIRDRLRSVRIFRHRLVNDNANLCAAAAKDIGKHPAETLACELIPLAEACRYLERFAARILRPRRVPLRQRPIWLWGQHDVVYYRPRGLVGIIGTWNYPHFLNGVQILQALTAGNGVIWKPSEVAPASSEALWNLLVQSGFPDGLLQRLPGTREAGRQLADADIDHVVFTGHAETGRLLAATLGKRLISSTLELSGCDAMFVLDDANVALAAKAAWFGSTINAGQTCVAARRVFVDRTRYPQFLEAVKPHAASASPM